ncbi:hypothetical protein CEXT_471851 [Caerostris extrusa]|uniref:Uncharacterized protein n=1 Tax=Caerostris extrusa TaxID=172846 RepID=A0AAV4PVV5_CAEEX|nr:hypothetical protein CEXT_471851 [Caerostris extrusa]
MRRLLRRKKSHFSIFMADSKASVAEKFELGMRRVIVERVQKFENILGSLTTLKFRVFNGTIFNLQASDISKTGNVDPPVAMPPTW